MYLHQKRTIQMRISTVLTSAALLVSLFVGTCTQAYAGTEVTIQRAVIEEDYNMYIQASGVANSDALHAKYTSERKAYLAGQSTQFTQTTVQSTTTVDEALKIQSYKDYDYLMYVKATGGVSNDTVHIRFNKERNEYLAGSNSANTTTTTQTTTVPATQPQSGTQPDNYEKIINGIRLIKLIFN
jgi:hypothetical protein